MAGQGDVPRTLEQKALSGDGFAILEGSRQGSYHPHMLFESLFRRLRRKFQAKEYAPVSPSDQTELEVDPDNPFPDIVTIEFGDVLDLHAIPPRQVRPVVEDYLEEAHRRGVRWVRIIHGRGIGVQRDTVRSILARTPYVVDFQNAPPEAGGWGATIVTLSCSE